MRLHMNKQKSFAVLFPALKIDISSYLYQFLNEINMRVHICRVVNTGDFKSEEPGSSQVGRSYFSFLFFFFCNLSDFYYLFSFRS